MTKQEIIDYVMNTPLNTNQSILSDLLDQYNSVEIDEETIKQAIEDYLKENPIQPVKIDSTLTQEGQAADAKAVGDRLKDYISINDKVILDGGNSSKF